MIIKIIIKLISILTICILLLSTNPLFLKNESRYENIIKISNVEEVKQKSSHIVMQSTAYTRSKEEGTSKGITRSGILVKRGMVAIDPTVIPLGTKLYIDGYGQAIACDTGGAIRGYRVDLFMNDKKEAIKWGRRDVKVWIVN